MDDEILKRLHARYASGNLIVFAGAGVSAGAGLPTWRQLAETLRNRVHKGNAEAAVLDEIDHYLASNQLINALSAAKLALGEQEFNRTVDRELDDAGREIPEIALAIAGLKPRLRAVLTTNLDGLLEKAFLGQWRMVDRPTGDLAMDRHYILKLHGTLRAWDTWVFSREQYDRAIFGSPLLQEIFGALYHSCSMLFVGCGLADDNLDQTLGRVRALSSGQPPEHFALLPQVVSPFRRKQLEASGLRLLVYDNADGRHAEVTRALRGLEESPAPAAPEATRSTLAPAVSVATRAAPAAAQPVTSAAGPRAGTSPRPVQVFLCYAARDQELLDRFVTHLAPLKREGVIAPWHAGKIGAGEDQERAIAEHLDQADLILLLVSASFLASEEGDAQIERAMERNAAGKAAVWPILLRPSDWETTRFGKLQPLPRSKTAVTLQRDEDEAFLGIAKELRAVATKLRDSL